ncbi:MAG: transposase, partial [Oligoflexia bacterium]|nr:transposase [Oligoflexia bacterium]
MASKDQGKSATQLGIDAVVDILGPRLDTDDHDAPPVSQDDLPVSESAQDTPRPGPRPVSGMDWLERHVSGRQSLCAPPDFDPDAKPQDTSAYGRRRDKLDPGKVIPPRSVGGPGSNLDPLLNIPVITVDTAPRPIETRPPPPEVQRPIPRVMILSSPADSQACPQCKGPLRVIRSTRENRLECTWFRLEWLEIERGWGDCKQHLQVETTRLARPAFLLPKGPVGNGLLARIATWRWQDHMPGHQIMRLLDGLEIRCTHTQVARWLQAAAVVIAPVAAAIRQASSGGKTDAHGLVVVDSGEEGRLRATVKGSLISYDWTPGDATPRPDDPKERTRDVLLDVRGWTQAGAQAHLRRLVARALATDRDRAARLSWRLEEL